MENELSHDADPGLLSEALAKGEEILGRGVTDFPKWSRVMVYSFGEPIRPHLERIWKSLQREGQMRQTGPLASPFADQPWLTVSQNGLRHRWSMQNWAVGVSIALAFMLGLGVARIWRIQPSSRSAPVEAANTSGKAPPDQRNLPRDFEQEAPDHRSALQVLADQGDADAQAALGWCYYSGEGVPQDYREAARWLHKSAEQGNAAAQFNLGHCYDTGEGVAKNPVEAMRWYRKSAEQGNALGQCALGSAYSVGVGVPQDYTEAARWLRKSAEQGEGNAQSLLGGLYARGEGVPTNWVEAVSWFRRAAEQGVLGAQVALAASYSIGNGVPQNDIEAYKWYTLAIAQGGQSIEIVKEARDALSKQMAREEVAEAQRRAAAFVPHSESAGNRK